MTRLDEKKLESLTRADDIIDAKYGRPGTAGRKEFESKAKAWYYAELLKAERKKQKVTQQELAERIGKRREYVSALERGNTDMQLSTFLQISHALGLRFSLVVG